MSNNNHHNLECGFAEKLVSILYGETNSAEKAEFDKHLDKCSTCGEELAAFGYIRSSINDWYEEFSSLETPKIEIPYFEQQKTVEISVNSNASRSWLAGLRQLFSLSPAWATATTAFAALAVFTGITIFVLNFSDTNEVSKTKVAENVNKTVASDEFTAVEKIVEKNQPEPNLIEEKTSKNIDPVITKKSSFPDRNIADGTKKPFKPSKNLGGDNKRPNARTLAQTNTNSGKDFKNIKVINKDAPKLTNFSEDEDNSLRLADLFDEVGSK